MYETNSASQVPAAMQHRFQLASGKEVALSEVCRRGRTLLLFLRHFG